MLEDPYSWVQDGENISRSEMTLDWMLSFEGRGAQGRVRAKVRKAEEDVAARGVRTRSSVRNTTRSPVRYPHMDPQGDWIE